MRPIKFRGRIAKDHVENWKHGEIIYGSLMVFADDPIAGCTHWIIDEKSKPYRNYPVDEDSIAQLVGYDKDGKEVYEGDVLTFEYDGKHYEYTAGLQPFARNDDGLVHYKFDSLKLKEAHKP